MLKSEHQLASETDIMTSKTIYLYFQYRYTANTTLENDLLWGHMATDDIRVSYLSPLASASGMMTMYVYNAAFIHIAHYGTGHGSECHILWMSYIVNGIYALSRAPIRCQGMIIRHDDWEGHWSFKYSICYKPVESRPRGMQIWPGVVTWRLLMSGHPTGARTPPCAMRYDIRWPGYRKPNASVSYTPPVMFRLVTLWNANAVESHDGCWCPYSNGPEAGREGQRAAGSLELLMSRHLCNAKASASCMKIKHSCVLSKQCCTLSATDYSWPL